ncbi:hypothetical protein HSR121_0096 [Halapricum desulfuricans]|uniref:Uncharacterized protein n=1 Tax=Halapricum desulfuricans TaxID=2841257 RepID=A0A897MVE4_9EURY|nr:hypothetical protein HSR121_0096 [Halapricum desulfuricans]
MLLLSDGRFLVRVSDGHSTCAMSTPERATDTVDRPGWRLSPDDPHAADFALEGVHDGLESRVGSTTTVPGKAGSADICYSIGRREVTASAAGGGQCHL